MHTRFRNLKQDSPNFDVLQFIREFCPNAPHRAIAVEVHGHNL